MRALIVFCLLLCAGCSQTTLLTRQDYQTSQQDFMRGDDENALLDFPRGSEDGDFITTMERGYLSLIRGKPQLVALQRQERLQRLLSLRLRQARFRLSREARTLFDARVPLDYRPSVPEVVWLHLLLGWGYAEQGKYADAAAEARLARDLLATPSNSEGHFDDPMLRLFLAGLWTMCGQWQEARTDLRAAWVLDHSLGWAKELAARERAPAQLFMVMGGPGPDVVWAPALGLNPLRSARRVSFVLRGRKSALSVQGAQGMALSTHLSPDAQHWYARHLVREGELTEMLGDLAYGGKGTENGVEATAIFAGSTGGYVVTGIVAGALVGPIVAIIGSGSSTQPDTGTTGTTTTSGGSYFSPGDFRLDAAIGATLGGLGGLGMGATKGYDTAAARLKANMDPAMHCRYVRYLPEYLWLAWTDQPLAYPVTLHTPLQTAEIPEPTVVNGTVVTLAHLVDTYESCRNCGSHHGAVTLLAPAEASSRPAVQPNIPNRAAMPLRICPQERVGGA